MLIATILPTPHLELLRGRPYQMALAHIAARDDAYADFYLAESRRGAYVLLDNGVVETGEAMPISDVLEIARRIEATEVILPDSIGNSGKTQFLALLSLLFARLDAHAATDRRLMAVPQGKTPEEWRDCLLELLTLPIDTIGISKFTLQFEGIESRADLLRVAGEELLEAEVEIHLLGCGATPWEIAEVERCWPGRVRGADSGVAAIAAQAGIDLSQAARRPEGVRLQFDQEVDEGLLLRNLAYWERAARGDQSRS